MSEAPTRTRLHATRRALWHALAAVLVLMALGAVAASRLLPMLERNPERVEAWLGERLGHPVAFDSLQTGWTRRGPLLRLDGLRVGHGDEAITIGEAEVLVAQYAGLLPGRSFTELRLRGLELTLERDDDGRWQVRGLPGEAQSGGDPFAAATLPPAPGRAWRLAWPEAWPDLVHAHAGAAGVEPELVGRLPSRVADDDHARGVDHDRLAEAELLD